MWRQRKLYTVFIILIVTSSFTILKHYNNLHSIKQYNSNRKLQQIESESTASYSADEACDIPFYQSYYGPIILLATVVYLLFGLATICEAELKASLLAITKMLKLPEDISGATFMAAATSAPELFTSLFAITSVADDIGVGTIVGSAVFNLLIIIGSSTLLTGLSLSIDWRPVVRDTTFNVIALSYLVFVFWDEHIYLAEALLGLILYIVFCVTMGFNKYLLRLCPTEAEKEKAEASKTESSAASNFLKPLQYSFMDRLGDEREVELSPMQFVTNFDISGKIEESDDSLTEIDLKETTTVANAYEIDEALVTKPADLRKLDVPAISITQTKSSDDLMELIEDGIQNNHTDISSVMEEAGTPATTTPSTSSLSEEEDDEKVDHFAKPTTIPGTIWYVITLPYRVLFHFTIPSAEPKFWKYQFIPSFLISVLWLGAITYGVVNLTELLGCIFKIDDAVMGVSFLAIGTSMPDCLTSIAIARTGRGDMAVCNALGSNVFDILLALPLPWLLKIIIAGGNPVTVSSNSLGAYIICLGIIMIVILCSFIISGWRFGPLLGFIFYFIYICFICFAVLLEVNVISLPFL